MKKLGVIREITEPTGWVNSFALANKSNGRIRVCLDPQNLNQALMHEHYYSPTFEDIAAKMVGSKIFSILDADQAFWQIELTEEDAKKATFNTPFGRFCFMRLPYGISSAPEVFHRFFSKIFEDIERVYMPSHKQSTMKL